MILLFKSLSIVPVLAAQTLHFKDLTDAQTGEKSPRLPRIWGLPTSTIYKRGNDRKIRGKRVDFSSVFDMFRSLNYVRDLF